MDVVIISHLKTCHSDNPAAQVAAARLALADRFKKMTPEALDSTERGGGVINWEGLEVDGYEEIRPITDQGDAFEPDFELGSDEHQAWECKAIEEFTP